jgi:hypothetical protein
MGKVASTPAPVKCNDVAPLGTPIKAKFPLASVVADCDEPGTETFNAPLAELTVPSTLALVVLDAVPLLLLPPQATTARLRTAMLPIRFIFFISSASLVTWKHTVHAARDKKRMGKIDKKNLSLRSVDGDHTRTQGTCVGMFHLSIPVA